jgi:hypothetical protein
VSARDDYPRLANKAANHTVWFSGAECERALDEIDRLRGCGEEVKDLSAKIHWLLFDSGLVDCPEGVFCFPDGDIWRRP